MSVFHSDLFRQQALIAGSWRDAADGTTLAVSNPSTGATLGQIPNMGRAEAQQAVDAAAAALPNWRALTAAQRAALLKNWHRLILENKTALAQIMTAEQGKPLAEAEGEIAYAASFIEWFAEQGKRANGEIIPSPGADKRLMVIRQGVGVCAAITPWNFPAAMITRKAGPALAADPHQEVFTSPAYSFRIAYPESLLFSLARLVNNGSGLLIFIFSVSLLFYFLMRKYLNVYTSEEEKLRYAITQGYIVPYYQPLVNGKTGEIYGVEILARWQNSTTPARSPAEFIPLAERTGLIIPLTRSLMAQVNAQMRPLFSKLPDGFHIGLNISVSHINAPTFIDDCLHYQRGFEGKAVKLMLEITEQEPLLLNGAVVDKLNTLHSRGFSVALDDFGTGYSGLSCLHELIFDYIKIDQSFVGRVTGEAPASKLLDCVIEMARTLSLRIIAEGVETEAQRDYLNRQNIHLLQGYYF
ncbi:aldehyde dehydrogenase family protein [Klebsiella pneumoniae]|nr:aldehyde dehydrogenase family protein [Klebsiella pneumoniae]MDH8176268.1 aldehyde dehydrogenase family protein [Klebsiella pneumoniae]MDH8379809.1 aldehyde dehydrogenase family protein [Klebsiella pneumoniae]HBY2302685.1 aldehyde dehydrogenase family protein [Klebsiella pneumoniae]